MVDVTFSCRAKHFIPLALFRYIAALPPSELPTDIEYVSEHGVKAIKGLSGYLFATYFGVKKRVTRFLEMALVNSGRLSVQPVNEEAWGVIEMMAEKGGWDGMNIDKRKAKTVKANDESKKATKGRATGKGKRKDRKEEEEDHDVTNDDSGNSAINSSTAGRKRKVSDGGEAANNRRRSTRARK
jgi:hypothetical protein